MTLSIRSISYQEHQQQAPASYHVALEQAEFVGLVGANGSGKSTLIKLLTGEYQPDSGDVEFNQISLIKQPSKFKQMLGYMPDKFATDNLFSVKDFLTYVAHCKQIEPNQVETVIKQLINDFQLTKLQNLPVSKLSLGQQQKVNLAQALTGNPALLVLDEPLNGLDPIEQQNFWQLLQQYQPSHVLMASHHLQELQQRCDRIIIVNSHSIAANIDLRNSLYLIALNKPATDIQNSQNTQQSPSPPQAERMISCKTEVEYRELKQIYQEQTLCSGKTLEVLNQLFKLQANGVWQW